MIKENLVFFRDDIKNDKDCLEFMIHQVDEVGLLNNKEEYLKAVYQREAEFSTAVGFGVAIPHGMSDAVNESFVAFMKSESLILWGKDQKEVQLVFLIGVPEHEKNITHLRYISQISKHLIDEKFRSELLNCKTVNEAFNYLNVINMGIKESE